MIYYNYKRKGSGFMNKEKVLKIANSLLLEINDDYEEIEVDTCFYAYPVLKSIFVSFDCEELEEGSEFIVDFRNRLGKEFNVSTFLISLLHECGHCETWFKTTRKQEKYNQKIKRWIEKGKRSSLDYFKLADERRATNWAIYFIRNNYELIKMYDKKIKES